MPIGGRTERRVQNKTEARARSRRHGHVGGRNRKWRANSSAVHCSVRAKSREGRGPPASFHAVAKAAALDRCVRGLCSLDGSADLFDFREPRRPRRRGPRLLPRPTKRVALPRERQKRARRTLPRRRMANRARRATRRPRDQVRTGPMEARIGLVEAASDSSRSPQGGKQTSLAGAAAIAGAKATSEKSEGGKETATQKQVAMTVDGTSQAATGDTEALGRKIPFFKATAIDNTTYKSADCKETVLVAALVGVECPLANLYYPRLVELAARYRGKSVAFIAVNSDAEDTLENVKKQAHTNKAAFPVSRTPETRWPACSAGTHARGLCLGRRTGRAIPRNDRRPIRDPATAVAADKELRCRRDRRTPRIPSGERGGNGRAGLPSAASRSGQERRTPAFTATFCPSCRTAAGEMCHRKGEIGPFALKDFAEVRDWGPTIREAVLERRMPPWPADPHFGKFSNGLST